MTIDIPEGTVCELRGGQVYRYAGGGRFVDGFNDTPFETQRDVIRTFSPDPTPDQEVPREEWASIKPGSRVRVEEDDGTVMELVVADKHRTVVVGKRHVTRWDFVARVYLLDEPDPDADLIERMAADLEQAWDSCSDWPEVGPAPVFRDMARAALAVVREADQ